MDRHEAGPRRLQAPQPRDYASFSVTPLAASLGGLVSGIDLRRPLSDRAFGKLPRAVEAAFDETFWLDQIDFEQAGSLIEAKLPPI